MDRLVNIRMRADLSETIQQFTQLNNVLTGLSSTMSGMGAGFGLGGAGNGMGGMGMPGMGVPGVGVPSGGGGGGTIPGMGATNPAGRNRGRGGGNLPPQSPNSFWAGTGITSQMFGLAQIGFALEDYQYAGWRGVMNNVPWIAQAAGNMAGMALGVPGLGQAALLGTAIGVPLGNAWWSNLDPSRQNEISQGIFGGAGMSDAEMTQLRTEKLQREMAKLQTGDYRRTGMEFDISRRIEAERNLGAGFDVLTRNYSLGSSQSVENRDVAIGTFGRMGQSGMIGRFRDEIQYAVSDSSAEERQEARRAVAKDIANGGVTGLIKTAITTAPGNIMQYMKTGEMAPVQRLIDQKLASMKEVDVNNEKILKEELGKMESGVEPDWKKMLAAADALGTDVYFSVKELKREYLRAKGSKRQDEFDAKIASEDDQLYRDAEEGVAIQLKKDQDDAAFNLMNQNMDIAEAKRKTGVMAGRQGSQIGAIIAGSKDEETIASRMEQYLKNEGFKQDQIDHLITPDFLRDIREQKQNRKGSDEQLWEQYSEQWINAVKSDILQAQHAASQGRNGRFNDRIFNEYLNRIKIRIRSDLRDAGVSPSRIPDYAEMIWNAAYEMAQNSYQDAANIGRNQIRASGYKGAVTDYMVNQAAMQALAGQMSDDLQAVYGNAQTNSFYVGRMMQQQYRRQQIRLNRFGGR